MTVPAALAGDTADVRADATPFSLVFRNGTKPVLKEIGAGAAPGPTTRLSYQLSDGSFHTVTSVLAKHGSAADTTYTLATDESGRTATVELRRTATGYHVDFSLSPAKGVVRTIDAFDGSDQFFLGGGERDTVGLLDQAIQLKVNRGCHANLAAPFLMSNHGWGLFVEGDASGELAVDAPYPAESFCHSSPPCPTVAAASSIQLCLDAPSLSYDVYVGDSMEALSAAFTARVGRPPLPPVSELGLIKWRDQLRSFDDVRRDVAAFRRLRIPLSWILIDNPWERGGCNGSLAFGTSLGNARKTVDRLHRQGLHVMAWVSPLVTRACGRQGYSPSELLPGGDASWLVDLADPKARAIFVERLTALARFGIDGFKGDRADEYAPGNRYPVLYARAAATALGRVHGRDRVMMWRAGWSGSQGILDGVWAGDQAQSLAGLRQAVYMGQSASVSGYPIWGSDVGGYHGAPGGAPKGDVTARWAQLGAVSPIFEIGTVGPSAGKGAGSQFWSFGKAAVDAVRRAGVLHYELVPFLYELARRASATGAPIMRPLGYDYPADSYAWYQPDELMLGKSLLARIVLVRQASRTIRVDVWLPPGDWVDLYANRTVSGKQNRPTTLAEFPLYLKSGSAIPFNFRSPQAFSPGWGLSELVSKRRSGWLYAPAPGRTKARYFGTRFTATTAGKRVTIRLEHATPQVAVKLVGGTRVCSVRTRGRHPARLAKMGSGALAKARSGWTVGAGGAPVIKLGAGTAKSVAVELC